MAMFDDPKKELKKLEEQLLKEEEWFESELEMAKALIGDAEEPAPRKAAPAQSGAGQQTQVFRAPETEAPVRKSAAAEKVRRNAVTDVNLDEDGNEDYAPKQKSNRGLVILAVLETLGIVGIVAYWLMFLL